MDPLTAELPRRFTQAAAWIAEQVESSVDELTRWCDQNSWSFNPAGLRSMAAQLTDDFAGSGIEFDSHSLPDLKLLGDAEQWQRQETGPMLVWHHNPAAAKRVLMMIHYDTVYPPNGQPNRCTMVGHRLVGPGTADAKGGIAVIKLATRAIRKFALADSMGVSILLNPDEEVGSTASSVSLRELAPSFDHALVFEPTLPDGSMVANRKGSGNFVFVVRGIAAHAGRNPEEGRNAIVRLAHLIPEITRLHDPDVGVLVNLGRITGGGPLEPCPRSRGGPTQCASRRSRRNGSGPTTNEPNRHPCQRR